MSKTTTVTTVTADKAATGADMAITAISENTAAEKEVVTTATAEATTATAETTTMATVTTATVTTPVEAATATPAPASPNSPPRLIAIDHGNANIKTKNHVFPSGYIECGHLPNLGSQDILLYNGKEYALSSKRMTQRSNKTKDEGHFILTLFAIGKELMMDKDKSFAVLQAHGGAVRIKLAAGLPPGYFKEGMKDFYQYLNRKGQIEFKLNNMRFCIEIEEVYIYPQAYAAARTLYKELKDAVYVNVVDIGGYTVDCLRLENFNPDVDVLVSLPKGVDTLFAGINNKIMAKMDKEIKDAVIEGVLLKDAKFLNTANTAPDRIMLIQEEAKAYTHDLLLRISRTGLDLARDTTVFIGGGALLIKDYILESGMAGKAIFADSVHANALGYEMIYEAQFKG